MITKKSLIDAFIKPYIELFGKQKQHKKELLEQAEEYMLNHDFGGFDFFSASEYSVIDELFWHTAVCGVQTISRAKIAERVSVSESTVDRAVRKIKKTGLLVFGRLGNKRAGVYAVVNVLHEKFNIAMSSLFGINDCSEFELKISNEDSIEDSIDDSTKAETPSAPRDEEAKSVSTYNTLNTFKTRMNKQQLQVAEIIGKSETLKPFSNEIAYKIFQHTMEDWEWNVVDNAVNRIMDNNYTPDHKVAYFRKTYTDAYHDELEARNELANIEPDFDVVEMNNKEFNEYKVDALGESLLQYDYFSKDRTNDRDLSLYYNWLEE
ncbi:hypothetical protein LC065_20080 (plasmid) [Halobacillus litoralis]|uniref:HTH domain-containing protein n=1 Tax=Halobacillus litoralis TaxID=45668 RepID=UPI001CFCC562|nr:HTH domain-containing protein [Halobacillus litoralis]WLR49607.1 hypothetical protein LC065_20080 [Halobacillus litoralis]